MFLGLRTSRIVASIIVWIRLESDNGDEDGVLQMQMLEAIQKARHSKNEGGGWRNKLRKKTGGEVAAKKVMSLTQNFAVLIFSTIQFLLLCVSWGSGNITVSNNKLHLRGYLYTLDSNITTSK